MPPPRLAPLAVLFAAVACAADDGGASEPRYLFGLDEDEIVAVVEHYDPSGDPDRVLLQLEAPFRCEHFPGACEEHGPERAEAIVATIWDAARERIPTDELLAIGGAEAAPIGPHVPIVQLPGATAEDAVACLRPPFYIDAVHFEASVTDYGLVVLARASYASTTTGGDLFVTTTDNAIDADLDISLANAAGAVLVSNSSSFVLAAEGTIAVGALSVSSLHVVEASLSTNDLDSPWLGVSCDGFAEVELQLG